MSKTISNLINKKKIIFNISNQQILGNISIETPKVIKMSNFKTSKSKFATPLNLFKIISLIKIETDIQLNREFIGVLELV